MAEIAMTTRIESMIFRIRGQAVMLDRDLALLYQVQTKVLNQAVKRNLSRFPEDFMFQLSREESEIISQISSGGSRSQNVTLKRGLNVKYLPYAFSEQGVAMLSSVLRSERAVQVNIEIMRTFIRLRHFLAAHTALSEKLFKLETRVDHHTSEIQAIFDTLRRLMTHGNPPVRRIGFDTRYPKGTP